jgi:hypothetical protein
MVREAVFDPLAQAVLIDGISEVQIRVAILFPCRSRGHAKLIGGFEPIEDLAPITLILCAASMAFVHDDEIEEIAREFSVETGAVFVSCDRLIRRKVHFAAQDYLAFNLVPCVAERSEDYCLRIVDEKVAVGEVQNAGLAMLARSVPPRRPQHPADLERHVRLAGTGRHREQNAALAPSDCFDGALDRDVLIVAWLFASCEIGRNQ